MATCKETSLLALSLVRRHLGAAVGNCHKWRRRKRGQTKRDVLVWICFVFFFTTLKGFSVLIEKERSEKKELKNK